MIVIGTDLVERYFSVRGGHRGIKVARTQYDAWRAIVLSAQWKTPQDVKKISSEGEHSQERPGGLQY
jgi:hypothetical protein